MNTQQPTEVEIRLNVQQGTFMILPAGKRGQASVIATVPTEGKWYCGMDVDWMSDYESPGVIVQFIEGEFWDDDENGDPREVDMNGYDYLAEQA